MKTKAPVTYPFKIGDRVKFMSGGPMMTVMDCQKIGCRAGYFDKGQIFRDHWFPFDTLETVSNTNQILLNSNTEK